MPPHARNPAETTPLSVQVVALGPDRAVEITTVLCDAFFDYPVMRYVLGATPDYTARLTTLVGLFVATRVARKDLMLGMHDQAGGMIAAALVNLPGNPVFPASFESLRESVWAELGPEERLRYDAYSAATQPFDLHTPHHHLGMIGVRHTAHGTGLGRVLLDRVHAVAAADPASTGVTLSTEVSRNVTLYEHFGYRVAGHARVAPELETWVMHRPAP